MCGFVLLVAAVALGIALAPYAFTILGWAVGLAVAAVALGVVVALLGALAGGLAGGMLLCIEWFTGRAERLGLGPAGATWAGVAAMMIVFALLAWGAGAVADYRSADAAPDPLMARITALRVQREERCLSDAALWAKKMAEGLTADRAKDYVESRPPPLDGACPQASP